MGTRRARVVGLAIAAALLAAPHSVATTPPAEPTAERRLPAPGAPIPRDPARLAGTLTRTTAELHRAVGRWHRAGDPSRGGPPRDVELLALHHQRMYRLLRRDAALARATLPRLERRLEREARAIVAAGRGLRAITPALAARRIRTKRPLPVGVLLRHYRAAERRFGIPWQALAALNFVESAFGKIRTDSAAGAQGPMQFMPATWRAYGLGGDVHDDRDAIMGAANYLRASGGARDLRRALWRYNHSAVYVEAVLRYTARIRDDARNLYVFYAWQLFVRTERGDLRLTGPGR